MNRCVEVNSSRLDTVQVPETLVSRLHKLEERLEGFDRNKFVTQTLQEAVKQKEEEENLKIDWNIQPVYLQEPSL